jgi:hypothetical protein
LGETEYRGTVHVCIVLKTVQEVSAVKLQIMSYAQKHAVGIAFVSHLTDLEFPFRRSQQLMSALSMVCAGFSCCCRMSNVETMQEKHAR